MKKRYYLSDNMNKKRESADSLFLCVGKKVYSQEVISTMPSKFAAKKKVELSVFIVIPPIKSPDIESSINVILDKVAGPLIVVPVATPCAETNMDSPPPATGKQLGGFTKVEVKVKLLVGTSGSVNVMVIKLPFSEQVGQTEANTVMIPLTRFPLMKANSSLVPVATALQEQRIPIFSPPLHEVITILCGRLFIGLDRKVTFKLKLLFLFPKKYDILKEKIKHK
jgi:hypothetical protein